MTALSRTSRVFMAALGLLVIGFAAVLVDAASAPDNEDIEFLTAITGLAGPAGSAHYLEPRSRDFRAGTGAVHPDLPPIRNLDFVHVP